MKRYFALLVVAFAALTSMSGCMKKIFEGGKKEWALVEINGKTYKEQYQMATFARGHSISCAVTMLDMDSLMFRFAPKGDVEYNLEIKAAGRFELDKWYPIVCSRSYARWTDTRKYYNIVSGMVKITAYDNSGNGVFSYGSLYRFEGEFLFDATGDKNPENVMRARNGKFSLLADAFDARLHDNDL